MVFNSAKFAHYLPFVDRMEECQEIVNETCKQFTSLYASLFAEPTSPSPVIERMIGDDQFPKVFKFYTAGGAPGVGTTSSAHQTAHHALPLLAC